MENKKEDDKKIYIIFIAVMVVLYGAGYLAGRLIAKGEKNGNLEVLLTSMKNTLTVTVPLLFILLAVVSLIVVLMLYLSCKKMYKKLQDAPNDDLWDLLEDKLNVPMILVNAMQIVDVFFFGFIIWLAEFASYGKDGGFETVVVVADFILFVLVLVAGMLVPKGIVDIEKKLNPEKQGNVFDFRFEKVWFSSCDEAQKLIAYKAAYHAFKNTNVACVILWILSFLGMFIFKTGIHPLLYVCVIWLVNTLSYMLRAAKLEKR